MKHWCVTVHMCTHGNTTSHNQIHKCVFLLVYQDEIKIIILLFLFSGLSLHMFDIKEQINQV